MEIIADKPPAAGTGFVVAPGFVLTCAHVILDGNGNAASEIRILVDNRYENATIKIATSPVFPDLALLAITDLTIPCVLLGSDPAPNTPLYSFGFPAGSKEMRGEATTLKAEGYREIHDDRQIHHFLKFKDGQVLGGSSGASLIDELDHSVCGVVKRTRNDAADLGGIGIPLSAVFEAFPEVRAAQDEYHRKDPRWRLARQKAEGPVPLKNPLRVVYGFNAGDLHHVGICAPDTFTTWNAVGPDLRAVVKRDGERIVCPELGTRYPAAA